MGVIFLQKYIAEVFMILTNTNYDLEKKAATFLPVRYIFVPFVAQSVIWKSVQNITSGLLFDSYAEM